jgi:hypothetical protein
VKLKDAADGSNAFVRALSSPCDMGRGAPTSARR